MKRVDTEDAACSHFGFTLVDVAFSPECHTAKNFQQQPKWAAAAWTRLMSMDRYYA